MVLQQMEPGLSSWPLSGNFLSRTQFACSSRLILAPSLHFYGIRQNWTNQNDGVASITQFPTAPGDSYTYECRTLQYGMLQKVLLFCASPLTDFLLCDNSCPKMYANMPTGSSWYHSHYSVQAWDAVLGGILINGPATANYDVDLGNLFLNDQSTCLTLLLISRLISSGHETTRANKWMLFYRSFLVFVLNWKAH